MNAPLVQDCHNEPIHIPGAIQPHGVLLVLDRESMRVVQAAGAVAARLGLDSWIGRTAADLLGADRAGLIAETAETAARGGFVTRWPGPDGSIFDVSAHRAGGRILVEFEPGPAVPTTGLTMLGELERAGYAFERAINLQVLCERAVAEFRRLTGFDRVMIYRCLDNEPGVVLAESRIPELGSFLNHHFPGSDIPNQARALYVRSLTRVIPDAGYEPAPLEPALPGEPPLDMSDSALRSVSPIHLQYLRNMGVGASASISIVVDGALWGLVACHNASPKAITYEARAACRILAAGLARQIKAREEAESFRERIRLRGFEDELVAALSRSPTPDLSLHLESLRKMLGADGIALVRGGERIASGSCPPAKQLDALARWAVGKSAGATFATHHLASVYPKAAAFAAAASGLLAITLSTEEPVAILWFRAEAVEVVNWAGNPHHAVELKPGEALTPRASFEAWSETVRGTAQRWTTAEIESAGRLRAAIFSLRQTRRLRELNTQLSETISDRDLLISQKEVLLGEVNHRVQNSLFLVSSFLTLQKREFSDPALQAALDEAQSRIRAIGLVHRRLYRGDQVETVDLDRYLTEMRDEMILSMGAEWTPYLIVDAAPALVPTDKAVSVGLIVTELVINANKYAYDGRPGPIEIALRQDSANLRLSVSDNGRGSAKHSGGFGTRMIESLVRQLDARLEYGSNDPGLRAVLTIPRS